MIRERGYAISHMKPETGKEGRSPTGPGIKNSSVRRPGPRSEKALQAIFDRNAALRNEFVYGVSTTGIFCRCDCPSRRPARQNIRIFTGPKEALKAGFRPCYRCRPEETFASQKHLVNSVLDSLHFGTSTLAELAREHGVSAGHLQKIFKKETGLSPGAYLKKRQMNEFRQKLQDGNSILDAAADSGFSSLRKPYEISKSSLGMRPSQVQKQGAGLKIEYTIQGTSLGFALLGRTRQGICALYLGSSRRSLEQELKRDFALASRQVCHEASLAKELLDYVEGRTIRSDLTLHLIGTDFQKQVWKALQKIPFGETVTYARIAHQIGRPRSSRAVGQACGANRIALLIPCHRVLSSDGSLGGYRWDPERKRLLLKRESMRDPGFSESPDFGPPLKGN